MNKVMMKYLLLMIVLGLAACAFTPAGNRENVPADPGEYLPRLQEMKQKMSVETSNTDLKVAYRQLYTKALRYFLDTGNAYFSNDDYDNAIAMYKNGLLVDPENALFLQRLYKAESYRESEPLLNDAIKFWTAKDYAAAQKSIDLILKRFPQNSKAKQLQKNLDEVIVKNVDNGPKINLDFDKIDLPSALAFIADSYGINVVLDSSVKDTQVSFHVKAMPFYEALGLLLETTRHSYRVIPPNTLLVFSDTKEKRTQYQSTSVKTYYLNSIEAKEMAGILRGVLDIKQVTINSVNNSVTLSEQDHVLRAAEQVIERNDVTKGEVAFDVEILEVNLSRSLLAGVDYGAYQIGTQTDGVPVTGSISDSIRESTTLSIPSVTLNAFKQDVDAKILANPKIRVMDGEKAKIHIGDRVPLRTSDILDATGQTRTTFEYQEIGIRLAVEPVIHTDEQVTIKLALEVSSLGENLGTAEQQAYKIGTRNAETVMLVKDGETAILGGLVKEEERNSSTQVPGLGTVSGLGQLFRNDDKSGNRSDILLTITPRIIRGPGSAASNQSAISVTSPHTDMLSVLRLDPVSSPTSIRSSAEPVKVVVEGAPQETAVSEQDDVADSAPPVVAPSEPTAQVEPAAPSSEAEATMQFDQDTYQMESGAASEASLLAGNLTQGSNLAFEVVFNPTLVTIEDVKALGSKVSNVTYQQAAEANVVTINASIVDTVAEQPEKIVHLQFNGKRKGTSYLVVRNIKLVDAEGNPVQTRAENARIKIQ